MERTSDSKPATVRQRRDHKPRCHAHVLVTVAKRGIDLACINDLLLLLLLEVVAEALLPREVVRTLYVVCDQVLDNIPIVNLMRDERC